VHPVAEAAPTHDTGEATRTSVAKLVKMAMTLNALAVWHLEASALLHAPAPSDHAAQVSLAADIHLGKLGPNYLN